MLDKEWCLKGLRSSELRAYWAVFVSINRKNPQTFGFSQRIFVWWTGQKEFRYLRPKLV